MNLVATKPLQDFLSPLRTGDSQLYDVACSFSKVFSDLASSRDDSLFSPVPVTYLPSGRESGRFLAVDVGITTLKVAFIDLLGEPATRSRSMSNQIRMARHSHVRRTLEKAWRIEERLKHDQPHELFLWIGNCIAEVVKDDLLSSAEDAPSHIETGIAFGLPIRQESLEEATLMPTGKGFTIDSDLDLRNSILQGYERHTQRREDDDERRPAKRQRYYALPKLKITALTNDAVATLLSLSYSIKSYPNSRVAMGIVLDEGCNATIPMTLSDLHPSKARLIASQEPNAGQTLVSTEWTLRGAAAPLHDHNIITKWDMQLDLQSAKPGFQPLEYMTGGRYIGELVRIICLDYFTSILGIAERSLPPNLTQPYMLRSDLIINLVASYSSTTTLAESLNREMPAPVSSGWTWTGKTASVLREILQAVQSRSAALVAAATVGLLASNHEISLRDTRTAPFSNNLLLSCSPSKSFHEMTFGSRPADWRGGPEELVVACIGGVIQQYPKYIETCQRYIDRLVIQCGPQEGGKSIFLREANDGVIIGAGVLAGMVAQRAKQS